MGNFVFEMFCRCISVAVLKSHVRLMFERLIISLWHSFVEHCTSCWRDTYVKLRFEVPNMLLMRDIGLIGLHLHPEFDIT